MNIARRIAWDDTILPFQLDRADVRGRVVRLDSVLERILGQHDYPAPVAGLVAEAALLTALIGQAIKLRWKLSLQIRGQGPIRLIATDYFGPTEDGGAAEMRAYADFDADALTQGEGLGLIGEGIFAILIDQGPGTVPYQGLTPLSGTSLADCAATYFAQSEQLPTRFALAMGEAAAPADAARWRGGAIMLQHLPGSSHEAVQEASGQAGLLAPEDMLNDAAEEKWTRAVTLMNTVEETELIGPQVGADDLLLRLFHEETPRVFEAQPVRFGCTCSPEKVTDSLAHCSVEEIAAMVTPGGKVTADCQFCGAHYAFDPAALGEGAERSGD